MLHLWSKSRQWAGSGAAQSEKLQGPPPSSPLPVVRPPPALSKQHYRLEPVGVSHTSRPFDGVPGFLLSLGGTLWEELAQFEFDERYLKTNLGAKVKSHVKVGVKKLLWLATGWCFWDPLTPPTQRGFGFEWFESASCVAQAVLTHRPPASALPRAGIEGVIFRPTLRGKSVEKTPISFPCG